MNTTIRQIIPDDLPLCYEHFARHRAESGQEEQHFMPFKADDESGPTGPVNDNLALSLNEPRWQRWFIALPDGAERIVGHANLKGHALKTALHRCELGIGIERPYRHQGIGKKLMDMAIQFASQSEQLKWVDVFVFAHNKTARKLYRKLGFIEVGTVVDRFRIDDSSIDDVIMTLEVA